MLPLTWILQLHQQVSGIVSQLQLNELGDTDSLWGGVPREAQSQEMRQKQGHQRNLMSLAPVAIANIKHNPVHSQVNINPHTESLFI